MAQIEDSGKEATRWQSKTQMYAVVGRSLFSHVPVQPILVG